MKLKECCVLVTPTSFGRNDPELKTKLEAAVGKVIYNPIRKPMTSEEVAELLPGVDGFIAGLDTIDAAALEKADRLKVIARYGVGYDQVDLEAARKKHIVVTNTPGANAVSVAELTLGLSGFDCRILAYDPYANVEFAKEHSVELVEQEVLLAQSDFVSLHLPLIKETTGMVNADFLSRMKEGSFLINAARGGLVNEKDLLAALKSGHIRGAALDAFAEEPLDPSNPLLALPQVIATPHLGAQTDGAVSNMGYMALEECLAVLSGKEPKFRIV
jgi:D-3-phosphoglycerate dehydrogenase